MVSEEYVRFVTMVMTQLDIDCVVHIESISGFDIVLDDMELAFKLKLQDFASVWQETIHGEDSSNYQFEMLDMHTAKEIAERLKKRLNI